MAMAYTSCSLAVFFFRYLPVAIGGCALVRIVFLSMQVFEVQQNRTCQGHSALVFGPRRLDPSALPKKATPEEAGATSHSHSSAQRSELNKAYGSSQFLKIPYMQLEDLGGSSLLPVRHVGGHGALGGRSPDLEDGAAAARPSCANAESGRESMRGEHANRIGN